MLVSLTIHFMFTSSNLIFLGPQVVAAAVAFFKFISGLLLEQSQVSDGENNDATQKNKESTHKRSKKSPHSPPTLSSTCLCTLTTIYHHLTTDLSSCLLAGATGWNCVQETRDAHTNLRHGASSIEFLFIFLSLFFYYFSFHTKLFASEKFSSTACFFCFFAFFSFFTATGPFSSKVAPVCEVCSEKQTIFWLWHPAQWLGLPGSSSFNFNFSLFFSKVFFTRLVRWREGIGVRWILVKVEKISRWTRFSFFSSSQVSKVICINSFWCSMTRNPPSCSCIHWTGNTSGYSIINSAFSSIKSVELKGLENEHARNSSKNIIKWTGKRSLMHAERGFSIFNFFSIFFFSGIIVHAFWLIKFPFVSSVELKNRFSCVKVDCWIECDDDCCRWRDVKSTESFPLNNNDHFFSLNSRPRRSQTTKTLISGRVKGSQSFSKSKISFCHHDDALNWKVSSIVTGAQSTENYIHKSAHGRKDDKVKSHDYRHLSDKQRRRRTRRAGEKRRQFRLIF